MKNSLLTIATVSGWLAFSPTIQAQPQHATDQAASAQTTEVRQQAPAASPRVQMAQMANQMEASIASSRPVADDDNSIPSVPAGLAGLLLMICALVTRHKD